MVPVSRKIIVCAAACAVAFAGLVFLARQHPSVENVSPSYFDFGTVARGSTIEFSARFLTVTNQGWVEKLLSRAPRAWAFTLEKWLPKKSRMSPTQLATLRPLVQAPPFIHVHQTDPDQNPNWYGGRPFVVMTCSLDTSRPGISSGQITVKIGGRQASLPVQFEVIQRTGAPRILVAASPFRSDATDNGAHFAGLTRVTSGLAAQIDWREELPGDLRGYRTLLLGDSALSGLSAAQAQTVRSFLAQGGRVILVCSYFFRGTVTKANEVLAGSGLRVLDQDGGRVVVTNIVPDRMTDGVHVLKFFRPSPIEVIDAVTAKLLVPAPDPSKSGYVAVARPIGGGEAIVITQSLWWHWIDEFRDTQAARLLENALSIRSQD